MASIWIKPPRASGDVWEPNARGQRDCLDIPQITLADHTTVRGRFQCLYPEERPSTRDR